MRFVHQQPVLAAGLRCVSVRAWNTRQLTSFADASTADQTFWSQVLGGLAGNQPSDPSYATQSYTVLSPTDNSLSRPLALTILMESWPVNTYPFLAVMPTGSTLIIAGESTPLLLLKDETWQ